MHTQTHTRAPFALLRFRRYEDALARLEANKAAAAELERIFADVSYLSRRVCPSQVPSGSFLSGESNSFDLLGVCVCTCVCVFTRSSCVGT